MRASIVWTVLRREWYETVRNRLLMSTILLPPIALTVVPIILAAAVGERERLPEYKAGRHRNVRPAVALGAQLESLIGPLEPAALIQSRLRGFDLGTGEGPQRPPDEL